MLAFIFELVAALFNLSTAILVCLWAVVDLIFHIVASLAGWKN